ncbi:hypothetical protein DNU06_04400 [Putridiphycobacter roseus]|uniref:Agmatine deiminase family protein n=1 Tax=Putridiphycobacter roseus TaxID=2219161 RepID=A0A2W1NEK9_9FLAO|nr:agmatine deiminase family protein [Putridiphycobacter roseus]PZE17865.1 hypothetical protein DNU06_04400 [Putridiphycobacter roseus]
MNFKSSILLLLVFFSFQYSYGQVLNPRHPAEWEEISSVVMEFREFKEGVNVTNETLDPYIKTALACIHEKVNFYILNPLDNYYYSKPVNLDSIFKSNGISSPYIHIIPIDTVLSAFPWVRDHGLNFVFSNDIGDATVYNFNNDYTGLFFASHLNFVSAIIKPRDNKNDYYTDGGNFLTDGHGTFNIAATDISEKLPTSLKVKYDFFYKNFGINQTLNVRVPFVHMDYFFKLIDEETAIVSYIPNNNYDIAIDKYFDHQYYIDQALISIAQHLKSVYGRELKYISIQNAPTTYDVKSKSALQTSKATYANSFILNKTVLIPQYNIQPYDSLAFNTYKKAMPGYEIVGVNCRKYAQYSGAIHCLTKEIYANHPIYAKHKWYKGTIENNGNGYPIHLIAKSSDGVLKANLHWKLKQDNTFQSIPMTLLSKDTFVTIIPPVEKLNTIHYFIEIESNNGKILHKPIVAPNHFYSFTVE